MDLTWKVYLETKESKALSLCEGFRGSGWGYNWHQGSEGPEDGDFYGDGWTYGFIVGEGYGFMGGGYSSDVWHSSP